jgi:hypothetical protein
MVLVYLGVIYSPRIDPNPNFGRMSLVSMTASALRGFVFLFVQWPRLITWIFIISIVGRLITYLFARMYVSIQKEEMWSDESIKIAMMIANRNGKEVIGALVATLISYYFVGI